MRRSARQRISTGKKQNKSRTLFENLPNDILVEIFEYLDAYDILRSFLNLNSRFNDLVENLPIDLHFNLPSLPEPDLLNARRDIAVLCQHHLVSLRLPVLPRESRFFPFGLMGAYLPRLESIVLAGIVYTRWPVVAPALQSLPSLRSLFIHFIHNSEIALSLDLYGYIPSFPVLKYCHISCEVPIHCPFYEVDSVKEESSVQHLTIDHSCGIRLFFNILRYSPCLTRVVCQNLGEIEPVQFYPWDEPIVQNLKSLIVQNCNMLQDELHLLFSRISLRLEDLQINVSMNQRLFIAHVWEGLISDHMPQLKRFTWIGSLVDPNEGSINKFRRLIREFASSSFWIQRGSSVSIETKKINSTYSADLIVRLNQPRWFHSLIGIEENFTGHVDFYCDLVVNRIFQNFGSLCTALEINCDLHQWIKFIDHFPNLKLMKIHCASNYDETFNRLTHTSNITKVVLYRLSQLKTIPMFFRLFPSIDWLTIEQPQKLTFDDIIYHILLHNAKRAVRLNQLYIVGADANEQTVENFKQTVYGGEVQLSYSVDYTHDKTISILRR